MAFLATAVRHHLSIRFSTQLTFSWPFTYKMWCNNYSESFNNFFLNKYISGMQLLKDIQRESNWSASFNRLTITACVTRCSCLMSAVLSAKWPLKCQNRAKEQSHDSDVISQDHTGEWWVCCFLTHSKLSPSIQIMANLPAVFEMISRNRLPWDKSVLKSRLALPDTTDAIETPEVSFRALAVIHSHSCIVYMHTQRQNTHVTWLD